MKSFDDWNRSFDRSFDRTEKVIKVAIGAVFLAVIGYWICIGLLAFEAFSFWAESDFSGGAKPVIERMWCGSEGCLSDEVTR